MSKLGVGVGEDFPVGEGGQPKEQPEQGAEASCCGPDWQEARRHWHEQRHRWREQKRLWRAQMRAEWRQRRHAMHEHFRHHFADGPDNGSEATWHGPEPRHLVIGALALIGLAALLGHRHHND